MDFENIARFDHPGHKRTPPRPNVSKFLISQTLQHVFIQKSFKAECKCWIQERRNYNIIVTGMTELIDHSTLDQRVPVRNHLQTCGMKCEERICQLSEIRGKKAKGITRCGHIERKHQGRTARLFYLFIGPLVLCTQTNTLRR